MNWAICDGDVPIMKALRSILGWRNTAWWRNRSAWEVATDPKNVQRWKHKFGFHNRGVQWDTPMSRRAGEVKDWIQLVAQGPHRKEDVTFSSLATMRQATEKRTERGGGVPSGVRGGLQSEDEGIVPSPVSRTMGVVVPWSGSTTKGG